MDRARRIATFWSWLPAFRCVAEYGSIQKASTVLHVSPSALSRTVRLLEDAVGASLFVRSASGLSLTDDGAALLEGTREAMRRVDDAWSNERKGEPRRAVGHHGAAAERLVARAAARLGGDARLVLRPIDEEAVVESLLRGELDVAVLPATAAPADTADVVVEPVGTLVYAYHAAAPDAAGVVVAAEHASEHDPHAIAASLEAAEILAEAMGARALLPTALVSRLPVVGPSAERLGLVALSRRPLSGAPPEWTRKLLAAMREVLG